MEINILGEIYTVEIRKRKDDPKLENADGYCETQSKKIILDDIEEDKMTLEKIDEYKKKVLRHEIVHELIKAFKSANSF